MPPLLANFRQGTRIGLEQRLGLEKQKHALVQPIGFLEKVGAFLEVLRQAGRQTQPLVLQRLFFQEPQGTLGFARFGEDAHVVAENAGQVFRRILRSEDLLGLLEKYQSSRGIPLLLLHFPLQLQTTSQVIGCVDRATDLLLPQEKPACFLQSALFLQDVSLAGIGGGPRRWAVNGLGDLLALLVETHGLGQLPLVDKNVGKVRERRRQIVQPPLPAAQLLHFLEQTQLLLLLATPAKDERLVAQGTDQLPMIGDR